MSYLVLARKSRPQTFEDVVGQKVVVKTLQNSLKRNRVAHAILFSGVRGVGKTTLARLMAKALNCQNGPTSIPCNKCESCSQITSGSALDLYEIDGASNRGIQEVRELKEKLKFMPTASPFKIVIIDEVHMLTTEAFNALLKTLEEPPAHVFFLFATTELHKIPITILSRCQRYELQRVSSQELAIHFANIALQEKVKIDDEALSLIVRESEGSVRDGLSLLDQVLSYAESPIAVDDVVDVLGLVSRDTLHDITIALLTCDKAKAISRLHTSFSYGMDIKRFMTDLLTIFRSLLLIKIGDCETLLDLSENDLSRMKEIAAGHSSESIHQKLTLLMQATEAIQFSLQPKLVLETSFISIIETRNVTPVTTLLTQLDKILPELPAIQNDFSDTGTLTTRSNEKDKKKAITSSQPLKDDQPPPPDSEPEQTGENNFRSTPPWETEEPPPIENTNDARVGVHDVHDTSPVTDQTDQEKKDIRKDWFDFIIYLKRLKPWMAQNLQQASKVNEINNELLLEFHNANDYTMLRTVDNRRILTEYVLDFFQKEYVVHFTTPDDPNDPNMKASEGPKQQRQKLATHPLVLMTEEIFGGQVGDIRIGSQNR